MTLHDLMSPDRYRRMEEAAKVAGESVEDALARSLDLTRIAQPI